MDLKKHLIERNAVITLAVLWVICAAFVLSHPHSFENATVPDEISYYDWGQLYNQGIWDVPLYDWYGVQTGFDYHVNSTGLFYLKITEEAIDAGGGKTNLQVRVTFQDDTPAIGAEVHVISQRPRVEQVKTTNATGHALFSGVPKAVLNVNAIYARPPGGGQPAVNLGATDVYDLGGTGGPYRATIEVSSFTLLSSSYSMSVDVVDSLGAPVPGAAVYHVLKGAGQNQQEPVGPTDAAGSISFTSDRFGSQTVIARKDPMRRNMPVASVVSHDGTYVAVNHWAPGYSVILGLLDRIGAAGLAGMLMMALAAVSTYMLARRLFDWRVAFVSCVLLLTCGVALMILWTVGMADYASMAFALAGAWLLVEAVWVKRRWFVSASLGVIGGMCIGAAVWVRYSTASLIIALVFLVVALSVKDLKELKWQTGRAATMLKRLLFRSLPFLAGLAILLVPLAMYNTSYFGGPLGASHNYGGQISIDTSDGNTTATVMTGNVYSNFDPADAISTMGPRLMWIIIVMPFVILMPVALYIGWRRLAVLFLLALFLSNFLLYVFVPWVASWLELGSSVQNTARSLEDMRYFLPAMPAAAILAGFALTDAMLVPRKRRLFGILILSLLIVLGFVVGQAGIDAEIKRGAAPGGGPGNPPPPGTSYTLVTVSQLLSNPNPYKETLVKLNNCTFDHWINSTAFLFRDGSSSIMLRIDLVGYTPPALSLGTHFNAQGVFHWFDGNQDGVPSPPELFISVKGGTSDSITLI